jgi:hypothetical protein
VGGWIGRAFRVKEEEGLGMETHGEHYERLFGLDGAWQLLDVELVLGKRNVKVEAMDMWLAFANSAGRHVPEAEIVHERFHIFKHLNEAVDNVRQQEHRALRKEGDETLTGTKQLWLFKPGELE